MIVNEITCFGKIKVVKLSAPFRLNMTSANLYNIAPEILDKSGTESVEILRIRSRAYDIIPDTVPGQTG